MIYTHYLLFLPNLIVYRISTDGGQYYILFPLSATKDFKQDHITIERVRDIAQRCSEGLYCGQNTPIEDIESISVLIEEFVDAFHHGKEEKLLSRDQT
jgi:hemerythrin-like domain-containing protein